MELDSVQIQRTMANDATNSNPFLAPGRKKFNLNLRSDGQIRDGEQSHSGITEINAKGICVAGFSEYLHGGVQQLAWPATLVWTGVALENHPLHR